MSAYKDKYSSRWVEEIEDITAWVLDLSEIYKCMSDKDIDIWIIHGLIHIDFSKDSLGVLLMKNFVVCFTTWICPEKGLV